MEVDKEEGFSASEGKEATGGEASCVVCVFY